MQRPDRCLMNRMVDLCQCRVHVQGLNRILRQAEFEQGPDSIVICDGRSITAPGMEAEEWNAVSRMSHDMELQVVDIVVYE